MMLRDKIIKLREFIKCNAFAVLPQTLGGLGISPIFADLKPKAGCSSRCRTCTVWDRRDTGELATSEWREVIEQLKKIGFIEIFFTGGDIFLRRDVFELMDFAHNQGLKVHCVTNGYALNGELARELMRLKLASISLSLDALGPELDGVRGTSGAARRVMNAVQQLRAHCNGGTQIRLAATLMKDTLESAKEVTEWAFAERLPIMYNLIHFTHYYTDTPFSREQYRLTEEDQKKLSAFVSWACIKLRDYPDLLPPRRHLDFIPSYFKDYRQRKLPCFKPLLNICIDPNGDARPCCSMEPVGNILEDGLQSLLQSSNYRRVVARALDKSCPGCSCHYNLSLDMNLRIRVGEFCSRLRSAIRKQPNAGN